MTLIAMGARAGAGIVVRKRRAVVRILQRIVFLQVAL
jgi:hypothetical protein